MLIQEIVKNLNYCYEDAEAYADYLKKRTLIEYRKAYNEKK